MVHGKNRIPYRIDRRLNGLAGSAYHAIISFGLPFEPEDSQYGKSRIIGPKRILRTLCLPIRCDCSGRTGLLSPSLSGMVGKGQLGLQVLATAKDEHLRLVESPAQPQSCGSAPPAVVNRTRGAGGKERPIDDRDCVSRIAAMESTALESVYNCFAALSPFAKSTIYLRDTEQADAAGI